MDIVKLFPMSHSLAMRGALILTLGHDESRYRPLLPSLTSLRHLQGTKPGGAGEQCACAKPYELVLRVDIAASRFDGKTVSTMAKPAETDYREVFMWCKNVSSCVVGVVNSLGPASF